MNTEDTPDETPLTVEAVTGWVDPEEYAGHLHHLAHVEDHHADRAERCRLAEAVVGRVGPADAWALIATGHQLQGQRYRELAGAYA